MTGFHKTIKGIDFEFIIREELDDNYLIVHAENISFEMRRDAQGEWKIQGRTKSWVMELEDNLARAIVAKNI